MSILFSILVCSRLGQRLGEQAMTRASFLAGLIAVSLLVSPVHAQRAWVEVRSPNFVVMSEGDERAARAVAWQFEQVRIALSKVWAWAAAPADRPVHVFAVRNEDAMKALAPKYWETRDGIRPTSVYVTAPDRYYIALRADVVADDRLGSANPYWGAYWSYSSVVIDRGLGRSMPLWLSRGLAAFMANTVVTDRSVQVGRLSVPSLQVLGERGRIRLAEFLAADRQSPWYTQGDRLQMFDAQAGVFVHYLMFGDKGAHRDGSDRFVGLIRDGRPAVEAFKTAFGDFEALENGLSLYIRQPLSQFVSVPADTAIKREAFSLRAIPAGESAAARAGFHAAMGRETEARTLIAEAAKLDPGLAAPHEVDGHLLDVKQDREGARQSYGRAIESRTSNFYTKYRWAALTWYRPDIDDATRARVREVLEDAVTVNDQYADSFALLSEVRVRLGANAAGVSAARTAVALDPDDVYNRLALARALANSSAHDEARKEATQALAMATTDSERRSANELVAFIDRNATRAPAASPASQAAGPASAGALSAVTMGLAQKCVAGDVGACDTVRPDVDRACAGGAMFACSIAAHIYGRGLGVPVDLDRGIAMFQKTCDDKSLGDCFNLALMLMTRGRVDDRPRVRESLSRACTGGHARACETLKSMPE